MVRQPNRQETTEKNNYGRVMKISKHTDLKNLRLGALRVQVPSRPPQNAGMVELADTADLLEVQRQSVEGQHFPLTPKIR